MQMEDHLGQLGDLLRHLVMGFFVNLHIYQIFFLIQLGIGLCLIRNKLLFVLYLSLIQIFLMHVGGGH